METNVTLSQVERLKLLNAIRDKMIADLKQQSNFISTENLKLIIQNFESDPDEFMWDDVRIMHKIFKQEIESRLRIEPKLNG